MSIVRSGSADLGAAIGDGNLCPFSPKPDESTRLELLASSMAQPPNPNPRKRKTKDSSFPPPLSEVAVADEAPTPLVGDESKETPTAEPEGKNDVDDLGAFFTILPDGTLAPDGGLPCEICGRDHAGCSCAYLTEFPADGKLLNTTDYIIVCDCGLSLADDGRCSGGRCVSWRPKRVLNKTLLESIRQQFLQRWHSKKEHS